MERRSETAIEKFERWWITGSVTLCSVITSQLQDVIEAKAKLFPPLVTTLILVLIAAWIAQEISSLILSKLYMARSILMGENDIEGYWYDAVYDERHKRVSVGILRFFYRDGKFQVEGRGYVEHKGKMIDMGNFETVISNFDGKKFEYLYKSYGIKVGNQEATGQGHYTFLNTGKKYRTFSGKMQDSSYTATLSIEGKRVDKSKNKDMLNEDEWIKMARSAWHEFPDVWGEENFPTSTEKSTA